MSLIKSVQEITESGPVIRFDEGADLDGVLMELVQLMAREGWQATDFWGEDDPTRIETGWDNPIDGAEVGWFRWTPCPRSCGEHGSHIQPLGEDRPTNGAGRGTWYGMWFR